MTSTPTYDENTPLSPAEYAEVTRFGLDLPSDRIEQIMARMAAATPGPWHWAGNVDTGEPYLATWIPGAGRCQVLSIGSEYRSSVGPAADKVRESAIEHDLGDPDDVVRDWVHDSFGNTVTDPRLWFMTDLMAAPARDLVIFEVAREATSRDDERVYRGDIVGVRHPDAEFISNAPTDLAYLMAENARLQGVIEAVRAYANDAVYIKGVQSRLIALTDTPQERIKP
jgi:hypothetical protein